MRVLYSAIVLTSAIGLTSAAHAADVAAPEPAATCPYGFGSKRGGGRQLGELHCVRCR